MDKKDEGGKGGGDNAERSIARSNKKIDKNVMGDIRKFGRLVPGNDQLPIPENFNVCWPKDNPCSFARIITC